MYNTIWSHSHSHTHTHSLHILPPKACSPLQCTAIAPSAFSATVRNRLYRYGEETNHMTTWWCHNDIIQYDITYLGWNFANVLVIMILVGSNSNVTQVTWVTTDFSLYSSEAYHTLALALPYITTHNMQSTQVICRQIVKAPLWYARVHKNGRLE